MPETQKTSKSNSRSTTGAILLAVGVAGVFVIPMLMTGGDKGDAGLIWFLMGIPAGLIFGAIFIVTGIVLLVTKESPDPESEQRNNQTTDKAIKKLPLGD